MSNINEMRLEFTARSENEAFARLAISGFMLPLDPTMEQLADVKTAVSEAVTNAIIHGYGGRGGMVGLRAAYGSEGDLEIEIIDQGRGIDDVQRARQPFFTTCKGEDRSGMGFTVMESFMDDVEVKSAPGKGTTVIMTKQLRDDAIPHEA
ncbi:MAG: anti-sigma F factor [Clostridia bacterium]|nr:anti-sigma F factor [Clostridia bacterium]MBQ3480042.1 anti-sigma F factor [Clostridia bacterium]MBQ6120418.1 anti-sigma F factor [Clostridia bacterium]MBQ6327351.1 anti-sigma F factor [Clostridia bacterium]MBQ8964319.1 anti-sigma F factor [Clostridia bacterium]